MQNTHTGSGLIQLWKIPPIVKGTLTSIPVFNAWRLRRAATGGSESSRYCYSVWLRHLVTLHRHGFRIADACVGELGPGDSIGTGLAALLSGATKYVGLDIVPFLGRSDLEAVHNELVQMYLQREPIPNDNEFPHIRPKLESYEYPKQLIEWTEFTSRAETIRCEVKTGLTTGQRVTYRAPWTSPDDIALATLDLVFSQAVLEHVDDLEQAYRAMFSWLKPGGYASHVIDFSAHHLSPFWNGHWAYSDKEWRLVRGSREFLLNRQPLSAHLHYAKRAGLDVLELQKDYKDQGLDRCALSKAFRMLDAEEPATAGTVLFLRKP